MLEGVGSTYPPVKGSRVRAPPEPKQKGLNGRDAGIAKANSAPKQGPKTPLERFNENRTNETARLSRKHEMDHELRMENARNKRYKYEFKYGAPQRAAEATLKAAEIERGTRIEELKLQVELTRLQQGMATPPPNIGSTSAAAPTLAPPSMPMYDEPQASTSTGPGTLGFGQNGYTSDDIFGGSMSSYSSPYYSTS